MADNYFVLLNGLSKENKLRLIAKLSNSMVKNEDRIDKYFGAFISDKSAQKIIKELRESRNFNRSVEAF